MNDDLTPEEIAKVDALALQTADCMRNCAAENGFCFSFIYGPNGGRHPKTQPMQIAG